MTQRALGHHRPGHFGQSLDYGDTASAYDPANDIPLNAKNAKRQIHETFLDANILGLKKAPWNNLTKPDGPFPSDHGPWHKGMPFAPKFPDRSLKRVLSVGISTRPEIDYRAEHLPKRDPVLPTKTNKLQFDPRKLLGDKMPANLGGTGSAQEQFGSTIPPGKQGMKQTRFIVDVDATGSLDFKLPWNPSTEMDPVWKVTNHNFQLEKAFANSERKGRRLAASRRSLVSTYKDNLQVQRENKKIEALLQGDFEDVLAAVELQKGKAENIALEATKRAEIDRIDIVYSKDWKSREYYCDGVWRMDPVHGEYCWSCCGSNVKDGPGCCPRPKRR